MTIVALTVVSFQLAEILFVDCHSKEEFPVHRSHSFLLCHLVLGLKIHLEVPWFS